MTPEKRLWQQVVLQAVLDATHANDGENSPEQFRATRDARRWIEGNGRDYQRVCSLAGIDHEMIRDAFMAGRINRKALRKTYEAAE